jgi:hypothetical protein
MTESDYDRQVEEAIAAGDIPTLLKFVYGHPCQCTRKKGDPMCVCRMLEQAARAKIVPLALFKGEIQRVGG